MDKLKYYLICLVMTSVYAFAGQPEKGISVTGMVSDDNNEPLIGVSVVVAGGTAGTITDVNGHYKIIVPGSNSMLKFNYIGYLAQTKQVGNNSVINIRMEESSRTLDEVVVVGYDTQRKANLTGAVGSVDVTKQLEGRPLPDIGRGLQGSVPGLSVTTTSGRIGSSPSLKIRGAIGSLIDGASSPLILVDGVEISDLSFINPDNVESISVLKDAASSSIYGTRAAFGVVLLTTKKGSEKEHFSISYSNNYSWATPTVLPELAKSYEGAEMALEARQRTSPGTVNFTNTANLVWNEESIERMKEWERVYGGLNLSPEMVYGRDFEVISGVPYFYRSFNAAEKYIKKYSPSQQHNISVSGTTGKTNVYLGLGYMGQGGVVKVKPDKYDRYNVNMNMETKVNNWLTTRGKFLYSRTDLKTPFNFSSSSSYDALYYLYRWPSIMPYGTYEGHPFRNSVTETAAANYNTDQKDYMRVSIGATVSFTKDLSLDMDYTFNTDNEMIIQRGGEVGGWDFWSGPLVLKDNWADVSKNKIDQYFYNRDYQAGNAVLRYKKTIKAHKLNVIAGWNIEQKEAHFLNGEKRELLDLTKPEVSLAIGDQYVYGSHSDWAIMGFFGRINYSYADRYLFELNGRYDGSSKFPVNQQFGFFPSGSLGWIISEEPFMEEIKPIMSFAKIRASYGSIGNQAVGDNRFRSILATSTSGWIIDDVNETSFGTPNAISNNFTWETIESKNIGLDLRFFNDKLGVTADLYQRKNKDMISVGEEVPSFFGASAPYTNVGELTTNGWEIGVDFHHAFDNQLRLGVTLNLSDALSTITKHRNGSNTTIDGTNYQGKIYGEIWGFETDRFFTADDFNEDGSMKEGIPSQAIFETNGWFKYMPGDVKYKDLDGNKVIDWGDNTSKNPGDMKRIGNSTPRYEYNSRINLEWKGLDFELFIQGVGKRDYWGTGNMIIPGWNHYEGVFYAHQTDYWREDNLDAFYPRLTQFGQITQYSRAAALNFFPQTKYLLDMSYCRIKNITLGYSFSQKLLQKIKIDRLRIYTSFENIFEFDHLGDIPIDPETGQSTGDGGTMGFGRIYPYTRSASMGVQLKF
mgnify:CR=1 FL=1